MKFKILNGTPDHSAPSLCFSCSNGHVIQGQTQSNFTVRCMANISGPAITIHEPITSCTEYGRRWDQSLREMKEIAHILITKKGKPVGFVPASQVKEKVAAGADDVDDKAEVREVQDHD